MESHEVKEIRDELNLTQYELAIKLDTTPMTVSRWERGVSKPSKVFVREMARMWNQSKNK